MSEVYAERPCGYCGTMLDTYGREQGGWVNHSAWVCRDKVMIALAQARAERLELAQGIENLLLVATSDTDAEGYIVAYHFKTGALHRLLAKARSLEPGTNRVEHPFAANCPCATCRETQSKALDDVAREAERQLLAQARAEVERLTRELAFSREHVTRLIQTRLIQMHARATHSGNRAAANAPFARPAKPSPPRTNRRDPAQTPCAVRSLYV